MLCLLLFNPALVLFLLTAGLFLARTGEPPAEYGFAPTRVVEFRGWIKRRPEIRRDSLFLVLQPLEVRQKNEPVLFPGDLALTIHSSSSPPSTFFDGRLQFGEILEFTALLDEPPFYAIPGVTDFRAVSRRAGIYFQAHLKSPRQVRRAGAHFPASLAAPLFRFLENFELQLKSRFEADQAGLILGTFLGQKETFDEQKKRAIQQLGIYHLFVVSGFHVSLVAIFLHRLLRGWGKSGRLLTLVGVWIYILLAGWSVPAVRAGIMTTFGYLLFSAGLTRNLLNAVGLSGLVLVVVSPELLLSVGFQFSYASLLALGMAGFLLSVQIRMIRLGVSDVYSESLLLFQDSGTALRRKVRFTLEEQLDLVGLTVPGIVAITAGKLASFFLSLLSAGLAIQLALLPLTLYYSNFWSFGHLFNNLLFVPLISLFLPLCFGYLLVWWTPLAIPAGWLLGSYSRFLLTLVAWSGRLTPVMHLPHPRLLEIAVYLVFVIVACLFLRGFRRFAVLLGPLVLIGILLFCGGQNRDLLEVNMLDVGQGESIHVAHPNGANVLIDTGGSRYFPDSDFVGEKLLARYLWQQRIRRLSFIVITHPDLDHFQGFRFLDRVFPPAPTFYSDETLPLSDKNRAIRMSSGDRIQVGEVEYLVLHPPRQELASLRDRNNGSLVLELRFRQFSMLFTGDIERAVEEKIAPRLAPVTVLKVAHHGSATSSSPALLRAAQPRLALISAGRKNSFGHPSEQVLQRLAEAGIPAFATSEWGSLKIVSDGNSWELHRYSTETGDFQKLFSAPAQKE